MSDRHLNIAPPPSDPIDWHELVGKVHRHDSDIDNIKDRVSDKGEIIQAMNTKIGQLELKQTSLETRVTTLTETIEKLKDGIVNFRYWLVGTIVTCTIATLTFWNSESSEFEKRIDDKVSSMEVISNTRYQKLEDKIDKSNEKIFNLVKESLNK